MAKSDDAPITFLVPGQRVAGAMRGAGISSVAPPLGLGGTLKESVRLAAVRSSGNLTSVVADPAGRNIPHVGQSHSIKVTPL